MTDGGERSCAGSEPDVAFERGLAELAVRGGDAGDSWCRGLCAIGDAPAEGVGDSLAAAIAGLDEGQFSRMCSAATGLGLLKPVTRRAGTVGWRVPAPMAQPVRARADRALAVERMTGWFLPRLPEEGAGQGRRWREVGSELAALRAWLAQVPKDSRRAAVNAGRTFAIMVGPFDVWRRLWETTLLRRRSCRSTSGCGRRASWRSAGRTTHSCC